MLDETDIQKLLRLKRHEQPPAGYHQKFLQDFHRRQRAELLRQPVWKIAVERMGAFFSEHSMGRAAYAAATVAVLLFAGVASYDMVMVNNGGTSPHMVAANTDPGITTTTVSDNPPAVSLTLGRQVFQPSTPLPEQRTAQIAGPHYVIDSQPVSYERQFSF